MNPYKASLWVAKFALTLVLCAGIAYGACITIVLGVAKSIDTYQNYHLARYMRDVEQCVHDTKTLPTGWNNVREYCDTKEGQ